MLKEEEVKVGQIKSEKLLPRPSLVLLMKVKVMRMVLVMLLLVMMVLITY